MLALGDSAPRKGADAMTFVGCDLHTLMQRLGHTVLVGDASKIRAMVVRKTKTDRRDALHILDLLRHDRFPTIWVPDPATRDLRALLTHRMRLVRIRTMVKNGLHAIALNYRLVRGAKLLRQAGLPDATTLAWKIHERTVLTATSAP